MHVPASRRQGHQASLPTERVRFEYMSSTQQTALGSRQTCLQSSADSSMSCAEVSARPRGGLDSESRVCLAWQAAGCKWSSLQQTCRPVLDTMAPQAGIRPHMPAPHVASRRPSSVSDEDPLSSIRVHMSGMRAPCVRPITRDRS